MGVREKSRVDDERRIEVRGMGTALPMVGSYLEIVAMCQSFFSHVAICLKKHDPGRNKAKILTRGPIGSAPVAE